MFPLRDENPSTVFPFFNILLIVANALMFYLELKGDASSTLLISGFALHPFDLTHQVRPSSPEALAPVLTLLSSLFIHGGWLHLLGNMWFLWIFGDNIEEALGHLRYLLFYLMSGVAASLTHVALNPDSHVPVIGASGAISGVLGAYMVLFPKVRIKTVLILVIFIKIVRVPAFFFLAIWFVLQLLGDQGSGVAFAAHVGGFVFGVVAMAFFPKTQAYRLRPRMRWTGN